jgi:glycosyltransferase involved in cell wall biosynthesis
MHVALVAPLVWPVRDDRPPLGGVEVFLRDLIPGLAAAGVRVSLLAADGSHVEHAEVPRLGIDPERLALAQLGATAEAERPDLADQQRAFGKVRDWCAARAGDLGLDVVHAHAFDAPAFDALADLEGVCVMHTLHLPPIQPGVVRAARRAARAGNVLVAVSAALARAWQDVGVPIAGVVPNGIDVASIAFGASHRGYVLFAGRLSPEKGPELAVDAAARAELPLLLVGNIYDAAYFDAHLRGVVKERVELELELGLGLDWTARDGALPGGATYIGHRERAEVLGLMAGAAATLMPVRWDEPFGLVAIEAQAAGSPVVGFDRGALGEVVRNGQTGILVPGDDPVRLATSIRRAMSLDRAACRRWVEQRFSLRRMLAQYVALYREVAS